MRRLRPLHRIKRPRRVSQAQRRRSCRNGRPRIRLVASNPHPLRPIFGRALTPWIPPTLHSPESSENLGIHWVFSIVLGRWDCWRGASGSPVKWFVLFITALYVTPSLILCHPLSPLFMISRRKHNFHVLIHPLPSSYRSRRHRN